MVHMEVDTQVMIITIAFLTQKNVTVQLWTYFWPPCVHVCLCVHTHVHTCTHIYVHTCVHTYIKHCCGRLYLATAIAAAPPSHVFSHRKRGHAPSPLNRWGGACDHSTVMLRDFLGRVMVMG